MKLIFIPKLKGMFTNFTWGVHGTVSSSGIRFIFNVFHSNHPCGRYSQFNGERKFRDFGQNLWEILFFDMKKIIVHFVLFTLQIPLRDYRVGFGYRIRELVEFYSGYRNLYDTK